jgi:hypothetical protein
MESLQSPANANLQGTKTVAEIGEREGWSPDRYAIALSENIRDSRVGLDAQRERIIALCSVASGLAGDQASAQELSRHFSILEALFHRFSRQAHEALKDDRPRASEVADRFLGAALKAQRAAMATLSALKVLRDEHRAPSASSPASATTPSSGPKPTATVTMSTTTFVPDSLIEYSVTASSTLLAADESDLSETTTMVLDMEGPLTVSLRQICMNYFFVLATVALEFNPMRSQADGQDGEGRASQRNWREPGATQAAFYMLA